MFSQILFKSSNAVYVFTVLLSILIGVVTIKEWIKRRKYISITGKLPTAFGIPILGISYKWIPMTNFFPSFDSFFEKFQSYTYCAWFGSNPFIVTADLDVIKIVLSSEDFLNKSTSAYTPVDNALHNGIITSSVTKWKHNRKLMNSSFNPTILRQFLPIFRTGTSTIIAKLNELVNKGEQDVFGIVKRIVLRIAFETTMGVVIQDGIAVDEQIVASFNFIIEKIAEDAMLSFVNLGFITRNKKYYEAIRFLKDYVNNLIENKLKAKHLNNNQEIDNSENLKKKSHPIFIDQAFALFQSGKFQLEDVISESQTMIAGSFETVSTTLYSVLVLLSMHPDIQEKLFEEIQLILPSKDIVIEYEHLKSIPYMDMIINETLRLLPSIPFIARDVIRDTHLDDLFLPKDFQIAIPIFNLHRRKDIWGEHANDFNPDNFLPENIAKRHPYAYIPFSKGARNCIGWRYAEIALRVTLLGILRNFKFSTSFKYEDLVFVEHVSIRYDKEPLLKVEKRE